MRHRLFTIVLALAGLLGSGWELAGALAKSAEARQAAAVAADELRATVRP